VQGARGTEIQKMRERASIIRPTMDAYTDLVPTIQEQAAKRLDPALFR
jgi:hypothetical protein